MSLSYLLSGPTFCNAFSYLINAPRLSQNITCQALIFFSLLCLREWGPLMRKIAFSSTSCSISPGPLREASDSPPFPLSCPCEGKRGIDMALISSVTSHFLTQSPNMSQWETQAVARTRTQAVESGSFRTLKSSLYASIVFAAVSYHLDSLPALRVEELFRSDYFQFQIANVSEVTTFTTLIYLGLFLLR